MECSINQINVRGVRSAIPFLGPLQCQDIPVPALHGQGSFAEVRCCSGTLRTPGSLMEDLFEVRFTPGPVSSLSGSVPLVQYRVQQIMQPSTASDPPERVLSHPNSKKILSPFGMSHQSTAISPKLQNQISLFRTGTTLTPLPAFHVTVCTVPGSSRAGGTKNHGLRSVTNCSHCLRLW